MFAILLCTQLTACAFLQGRETINKGAILSLPEGQNVIELPIHEVSGLLAIPVQLNGSNKELLFALDTGSFLPVLFRTEKAKHINLSSGSTLHIGGRGSGSATKARWFKDATLTFGGAKLEGLRGIEVKLEDFGNYLREYGDLPNPELWQMDGIIGYSLFSRFAVEVNYARGFIRLHRPETFAPPAGAVSVPMKISDTRVLLPIKAQINSQTETLDLQGLIDTGTTSPLAFRNENKLFVETDTGIPLNGGFGFSGSGDGRTLNRWHSLSIGDFKFAGPLVRLTSEDSGSFSPDILIGWRLLSRFHYIMDYQNERIYLMPDKMTFKPFEFNMSGLGLIPNPDGLYVSSVAENSPASNAGLKKSDIVISMDGKPAHTLSAKDIKAFSAKGNGEKLDICWQRNGKSQCTEIILKKRI